MRPSVSLAYLLAGFLGLLSVFSTQRGQAAEPLLEKVNVFECGNGGYVAYRIPAIIETKSGKVLAFCEARKTGRGDWDSIDLMMRRSTDGGRTWDEPKQIGVVPGKQARNPLALANKHGKPTDLTYNNPAPIPDRNGSIHMVYCLEYHRAFYIRSDDDGQSWSSPAEITATFEKFREDYDWKVIATGPAHGIQLTNGRLVVPVWLSLGTGGNAHRPSVTTTVYSDDGGKSWQRGEIAIPNTEEWINPNETVVIQLADGRVMLNARSESHAHRRLVVHSKDGATGWTEPRFDQALLEPICMASIARVSQKPSDDKNRMVFANPHNLERADGKAKLGVGRDRKNLSIKLSYDEGETWPVNKALEPSFSAYSDTVTLKDGTILCFYENGRPGKEQQSGSFYGLTAARFNIAWLTDGKDDFGQK